jgi:hypothetical protein
MLFEGLKEKGVPAIGLSGMVSPAQQNLPKEK